MVRKVYESYQYQDPDKIYTYPGSKVLINKFNEKNDEKLRELEYQLVATQTLKLIAKPIMVREMKDLLEIHKFLFSDMYWWAGEYRKVNISKEGHSFMPMQSFGTAETYMNSLLDTFYDKANSREDMVKQLALILENLNYLHPFREGNGRTQREVIRVLGLSKGYDSEISIGSDNRIYNLYMDGTVYSNLELLEKLFDEILEEIPD